MLAMKRVPPPPQERSARPPPAPYSQRANPPLRPAPTASSSTSSASSGAAVQAAKPSMLKKAAASAPVYREGDKGGSLNTCDNLMSCIRLGGKLMNAVGGASRKNDCKEEEEEEDVAMGMSLFYDDLFDAKRTKASHDIKNSVDHARFDGFSYCPQPAAPPDIMIASEAVMDQLMGHLSARRASVRGGDECTEEINEEIDEWSDDDARKTNGAGYEEGIDDGWSGMDSASSGLRSTGLAIARPRKANISRDVLFISGDESDGAALPDRALRSITACDLEAILSKQRPNGSFDLSFYTTASICHLH
eukprot:Opistho-2@7492